MRLLGGGESKQARPLTCRRWHAQGPRVAILIVIALRVLVPLSILRYPLGGAIACLLLDAFDVVLVDALARLLGEPSDFGPVYPALDKVLDTWYLGIELFVAWTRWPEKVAPPDRRRAVRVAPRWRDPVRSVRRPTAAARLSQPVRELLPLRHDLPAVVPEAHPAQHPHAPGCPRRPAAAEARAGVAPALRAVPPVAVAQDDIRVTSASVPLRALNRWASDWRPRRNGPPARRAIRALSTSTCHERLARRMAGRIERADHSLGERRRASGSKTTFKSTMAGDPRAPSATLRA